MHGGGAEAARGADSEGLSGGGKGSGCSASGRGGATEGGAAGGLGGMGHVRGFDTLFRDKRVDTLFLDTTYCAPQHDFPLQIEAVRFVADMVKSNQFANPHTLFLFGTYTIGKEEVFLTAAREIGALVMSLYIFALVSLTHSRRVSIYLIPSHNPWRLNHHPCITLRSCVIETEGACVVEREGACVIEREGVSVTPTRSLTILSPPLVAPASRHTLASTPLWSCLLLALSLSRSLALSLLLSLSLSLSLLLSLFLPLSLSCTHTLSARIDKIEGACVIETERACLGLYVSIDLYASIYVCLCRSLWMYVCFIEAASPGLKGGISSSTISPSHMLPPSLYHTCSLYLLKASISRSMCRRAKAVCRGASEA